MHRDPPGPPAFGRAGRAERVRDQHRTAAVDLEKGCAVLTISSGHSVDYLLGAVAAGRENYYTGAVAAGEPPGRWYGRGAESLGLSGLVDEQDMTALFEHFLDPRDPAFTDPDRWAEASTLGHTGRRYLSEEELYARALEREPDASAERRAELRLDAGKRARKNVAFLDVTFSVQKSVTVLHAAFEAQEVAARKAGNHEAAAAWGAMRQAVEDAIWAGNRAALDYLADKAGYSRAGHHGGAAGRYIDAHDWTVASFFQHDNRDHDPQLHIHNTVLNRVEGSDGAWRTVDGRSLYRHRGAAAAVGERITEELLAHSLGVLAATRPDGKARELLGISAQVRDLFSPRRRAVTKHAAELVAAFETKFGRAPNGLELDRLQRQANFATRKAKSHGGESYEARLERWDAQLRAEVAGGLAEVAQDVLDLAGEAPDAQAWSPAAVIETALADIQSRKAAWTAPDLTRAISDALPDHLGITDGVEVAELVDQLTAEALQYAVPLDAARPGDDVRPDDLALANGESVYQAPGARLYATPDHVHTERTLLAATGARDAAALSPESARRFVESLAEAGIELGADQAAAVRGVLTSGACIESLVGPAGTGKSFVVGALTRAWQDPTRWDGTQRRVVGLASSQIATDVLAGEGLDARNVSRWLGTQQRLADGTAGGDDHQWQLRAGDLVVVDESAMADTADLAAVHQHAEQAGAKLLLVGDHRQLAAVGAGGGMDLLATAGASYELAEARRFSAEWERDASLRLRDADETVLGEYHKHGRLIDAGAIEQAETSAARAWLADTLAGRRSLLLVDTNEQAARLSAALRADLVRLGKVTEAGVPLGLQGTYAGVGDLVQARRNGWDLAGYEGNRRGPINRETYRVLEARDDGALVVAPVLGQGPDGEMHGDRITLPTSYVGEHVALGYASTVHAAQGLTVDTAHAVISPTTGPEALYVGLSRGRYASTAHVTTRAVPDDAPPGAVAEAVHRTPAAVLAGTLETADPQRSALATATESAADAESVRTPAELLADAAELAATARTAGWLDALADAGKLSAEQRAQLAAEDGARTLGRTLRRAELGGHDPRQVLLAAVTERPLDDARQLSNVVHHRITGSWPLDPVGHSYVEWTPRVDDPAWRRYLGSLADAADARRDELGDQVADEEPAWAVDAFGAPPDDRDQLAEWKKLAGAVAAHRELTGHDDSVEALGPAPKAGQVEAYASWRAAWRALGRPEADRDELELSDGQLRVRVRAAQREAAWAPRYVNNELAGTLQAADTHRHAAELRAAEAEAATDEPDRQTDLEQQASEARALADTLEQRATELREVDEARGKWLAHTAATRATADRATAELTARGIGRDEPDDTVTAEEWLAAHRAADAAEDHHRVITDEAELADVDQHRAADEESAAEHEPTAGTDTAERIEEPAEPSDGIVEPFPDRAGPVSETGAPDVRDVAADGPAPVEEDTVRVPAADETADSVQRAQRALAEIRARHALEERDAADQRAEQLTRWHADDQTTEHQAREHDAVAAGIGGDDD
ncbi:MAG: relaxase domain-containing protein [Pseudonocardiaceae bacterium]|nr:relaxase domain-containing protein [Pseudonocardiaceae bacterium]